VKVGLGGLACAALLVAGCGSSGGPEVTRQDGSQVELRDQARAWCGVEDPLSASAGQPRALHLVLGAFPPKPPHPGSYFWVSHRLSALRRSHVVTLGEDEDIATAYVFDSKTGNEVASNLNGAHGTVRFHDVSCKPGDEVRVSLDTVLVSENSGGGGPVHVRGELRARIGAVPKIGAGQ
jgi:hypothetical protein